MELVKNIFFNTDKLTRNSKVKISYTGKLFQNNSEEVYIHYGFGLLWENLNEIKMEKTDLGFQAEINLIDKETFNFCFKNEADAWDNNNNNNYIFELEDVSNDLISIETPEASIDTANPTPSIQGFTEKIKLAIYKIITSIPKLVSGTYKRNKIEE